MPYYDICNNISLYTIVGNYYLTSNSMKEGNKQIPMRMKILSQIHETTYHPCLKVYQLLVAWQGQSQLEEIFLHETLLFRGLEQSIKIEDSYEEYSEQPNQTFQPYNQISEKMAHGKIGMEQSYQDERKNKNGHSNRCNLNISLNKSYRRKEK